MIEVDSKQVLKLFAKLDSKKQKKVYRKALNDAAKEIVKETRKELKQYIKKTNTKHTSKGGKSYSLSSGIKGSAWKNAEGATISILGDFRLKFFEMGTKPRYVLKRKGKTLKKKAFRGRVPKNGGYYFFNKAQANKEKTIINNLNNYISKHIMKIAK